MEGEVVQVIETYTVDVTPVVEAVEALQAVVLEQSQVMQAGMTFLAGIFIGCCVLILLGMYFR